MDIMHVNAHLNTCQTLCVCVCMCVCVCLQERAWWASERWMLGVEWGRKNRLDLLSAALRFSDYSILPWAGPSWFQVLLEQCTPPGEWAALSQGVLLSVGPDAGSWPSTWPHGRLCPQGTTTLSSCTSSRRRQAWPSPALALSSTTAASTIRKCPPVSLNSLFLGSKLIQR